MSLFLDSTVPDPFYESRAIKVAGDVALPDGGTPLVNLDESVNPPQQVLSAEVHNDAAAVTGVRVQLWAMAFATAGSTDLYLSSVGGPTGVTIPAGGAGETVGALPVTFETAFRPQSTDPEVSAHFVEGQMHCCVQANVFANVNDKITDPAGPAMHLDFVNNRRHAQRNLVTQKLVVNNAMNFPMFVASPDPERAQEVVVEVVESPKPAVETWVVEEILKTLPAMRRTDTRFEGNVIPGFEFVINDERVPLRMPDKPLRDLEIAIGDACGRDLKLSLGPNEPQRAWLNASIPGEEFVLRVLDVTQTLDGRPFGGARVVLLSIPDELHDKYPKTAG